MQQCHAALGQPFLPIFGPPGTGKTRMSMELLIHIMQHWPSFSPRPLYVLCSTWTRAALEVMLQAFLERSEGFQCVCVRLGTSEDLPQHADVENLRLGPDAEKLRLIEKRVSPTVPFVLFGTVGKLSHAVDAYWNAVDVLLGKFQIGIQDEFTQVLGPASLPIPRFYVRSAGNDGLFVVAGDTRQLPAFSHSLFPPSTAMLNILRNHRVVSLDTQYRQHQSLGAVPSHFL